MFASNCIDFELDNALIVLIPKKDCPEHLSQFCSINLCSVMYKLVMKVIANRFKVFFRSLISQEQVGFIAGCNITDIITAQEVIHTMRLKWKENDWMAIKLDLEKAYDRVNWNFITASLRDTEVPDFLIFVIMKAISTLTMQILWNGVPIQKFKPA